jgi:hypothetical protein
MDQLQIDYQLRAVLADVQDIVAGVEYTLYGQKYKYMGTDLIHKQSMVLQRDHPELFNPQIALAMMRDPLGYKPPPFQLSPNVVAGVAAAAAVGKLADLAGMGDAVSKLAPGLSEAMEGLKGLASGITDKLPIKMLGPGSIAIPGQITAVKAAMDAALKGPTSAIAMAMKGGLLADVAKAADAAKAALGAASGALGAVAGAAGAAAGAIGGAVSLAGQAAGMAKAMSSGNPVAIASAAAGIASNFPMINPNAIASQMVSGALSGAGFDIASKLPNLSLSPDGIMKMMPIPGKLPTKDAKPPIKTAAPPKPVKPVELKNLFAEGAAAGSVSDLMKPLSQAMSIASTIASAASIAKMVTSSPAATSYGTQKLTTNANTINWGSNSSRPNTAKLAELRRMMLSTQIERHTKELDLMCATPYNILYSMPYSQLIQRYPAIKPNTPVANALQIIASVNAGLALAGVTIDIFSNLSSQNFESGGVIDSGAAASSTSTTVLLDDAYKELRTPTDAAGNIPQPTRPDRGAVTPNPQEPYDSSASAYKYLDGEFGNASNYGGNMTVANPKATTYDPYLNMELGFQDDQNWNSNLEKKLTDEVTAGPNLPDPNQGYDYGQQGDNSVGSDYG